MTHTTYPRAGNAGKDAPVKQLDNTWRNTSVSWGTMLPEDLVPAFCDVIELIYPERANAFRRTYQWYQYRLDQHTSRIHPFLNTERDNAIADHYVEQISFLLNEDIWNLMQDIAPDGCSFGSSEGDGADYGFWSVDDDDSED